MASILFVLGSFFIGWILPEFFEALSPNPSSCFDGFSINVISALGFSFIAIGLRF